MNAPVSRLLARILVFSSLMGVGWTQAAPGDPDGSFGAHQKGAGAAVYMLALQPDGKIVAGGDFTFISDATNGYARNRIARFNADGSVDTAFGAETKGVGGSVFALAVQPDGKILVGGSFTTVSDAGSSYNRSNIARFNADGSVDTAFGSDGKGVGGNLYTLAVQPDGKILIGGSFTNVSDAGGTHNRNNVARLNADGSVDTTFGTDAKGPGSDVNTLVLQPDGKVVIGGIFTDLTDGTGFFNRRRFARLNADGSVDTTFAAEDTGANDSVFSMVLQPDGKILLGGRFTSITDATGTTNRSRIARLNSNGSVDTGFGADAKGVAGPALSLALQADGKLVVGGSYIAVSDATGSYNRTRIARFNADGSVDTAFGTDSAGVNSFLYQVVFQEDGGIVLGGDFTSITGSAGSASRDRIARLVNDAAVSELSVPDPSTVRWLRGGSAPEVSGVLVELSTDNGATYSTLGEASRITGGWELTGVTIPLVCKLRARAAVPHSGIGSGLVQAEAEVSRTNAPRLTILGKKSFSTSKGKVTLRGTASDPDGDLVSVRYQVGNGSSLTARGTANWTAAVRLKPGSNRIQIQAFDSRTVGSAVGRVTVKRR